MNKLLPEPMKRLADELSRLPSIGPRQAIRLAFYLVQNGQNSLSQLATTLTELQKIKICSFCFFVHQNTGSLCSMCADPKRTESSTIAIVEKETDLLAIENTGRFGGRYFILGQLEKGGMFSETQKLRLQSLKQMIRKDYPQKLEELIVALSPTRFGDFFSESIHKEFSGEVKKISRLAIGLPRGAEIEFADDETLGSSFTKRG